MIFRVGISPDSHGSSCRCGQSKSLIGSQCLLCLPSICLLQNRLSHGWCCGVWRQEWKGGRGVWRGGLSVPPTSPSLPASCLAHWFPTWVISFCRLPPASHKAFSALHWPLISHQQVPFFRFSVDLGCCNF